LLAQTTAQEQEKERTGNFLGEKERESSLYINSFYGIDLLKIPGKEKIPARGMIMIKPLS
jgi:hypothetical protein